MTDLQKRLINLFSLSMQAHTEDTPVFFHFTGHVSILSLRIGFKESVFSDFIHMTDDLQEIRFDRDAVLDTMEEKLRELILKNSTPDKNVNEAAKEVDEARPAAAMSDRTGSPMQEDEPEPVFNDELPNVQVKDCVFNGVVWDGQAIEAVNNTAKALLNLTDIFKGQNININSLLTITDQEVPHE